MWNTIARLSAEHSLGFVAAAAAICAFAGWILADFMEQARRNGGARRAAWLAGTAFMAGLGTWTTHFMAMLGYRHDVLLDYGASTTVVSIVISVLAVGLPLAASALVSGRAARMFFGACSGAGVGAMHWTGMAAIEGCVQTNSLPFSVAAGILGTVCMAFARRSPRIRRLPTCLLFVAAVCGTHFTAIAGTRILDIYQPGDLGTHATLSIFTAAGAACIMLAAFLSVIVANRFDALEKAHSTILSTALQNMSNGLVFIGADETVGLWNQRFVDMFAIPAASLKIGMDVAAFVDVMGDAHGWDANRRTLAVSRMREWLVATDVRTVVYDLEGGRVVETEFRPVAEGGAVVTFDDVTAERASKERIETLAYNDALTGLPNRRSLQTRMEEGFSPKRRYKLLLIDLDRFKAVNDTHGHGVGDKLLIDVAVRLREIVGPDGFAARLGGDEMAVLVYGDQDAATSVAQTIVETVSRPYSIGGISVSVGCSIGMCCTDDASSPEELMQRADLALYEAKRNGRGQSACYRNGLQEAIAERHLLESDMRTALTRGEFHLVYQPVMSLADDRIVGYEALIRWEHPVRGSVAPAKFVPIAEENGLIVDIGRWVLEEACLEAASWDADLHVAVNVSAAQFRSPLLMSHVVGALSRSGLPASRLEVELTETAMVEDGKKIAGILKNLRTLGIRIAMDDFGTGYSSLAHLRDFPLDRIKIDQSFVSGAAGDVHSMAVIKAITQMGRDMGIPTLAEGVETQAQMDLMRSIGCDAVQGYLVGMPGRMAPRRTEAMRA